MASEGMIAETITIRGHNKVGVCAERRARRALGGSTMKVLLTGGAGDLGQTLVPRLLSKGDIPVILDIRAPLDRGATFIQGSVLDRSRLPDYFQGCDCIVHIAGWHGIHEDRGEKNACDFFDLNVRGTFEVFEAAASLGIDKTIYISTTSVRRPDTLYGRSKILAERIVEDYAKYRNMNVVTLRPRGFIPFWNHDVYISSATGRSGSGEVRCTSMMSPRPSCWVWT